MEALVDREPGGAAVVGAERAGGRNRDYDPVRVVGIENDGVEAHPARARLPEMSFHLAQPGKFGPALSTVRRAEQCGVLDASVDGIGVGKGRLHVPNTLEFPWVLRSVVPHMRSGIAVVTEVVSDWLPCFAGVVRALHHLAEPTARLRRINAIRIYGRAFEVVDLP